MDPSDQIQDHYENVDTSNSNSSGFPTITHPSNSAFQLSGFDVFWGVGLLDPEVGGGAFKALQKEAGRNPSLGDSMFVGGWAW